MDTQYIDRYIACMVLHGLGDTIGFKNGDWEFKEGRSKIAEKIYEFIDYGGINYIPQKGWRVSDDTIIHIKTAESLLQDFNSMNTLGKILKNNYLSAYKQFIKEGLKYRYPGAILMTNLRKMDKGLEWNKLPYDFMFGGSGASMRSSCIGLAFNGKDNRDLLIQISIESSRITHNSAVGYLGGLTSALFTAFAIEDIDIKKWGHMLIDLFENGTIDRYIKLVGRDVDDYMNDKHHFIGKWKEYITDKFDEKGNIIRKKTSINLLWRSDYYWENYSLQEEIDGKVKYFPGSGGLDSVIVAYDCLLDAGKKWEKLVFYAMMHGGDTDTTGSIAASWYGAIYGFDDIPKNSLKNLEMKDKLEEIGKDLHKKYYNNKPIKF